MSNTKARAEYLQHHWPRYPVLPQVSQGETLHWGRVQREGDSHVLVRPTEQVAFSLEHLQWFSAQAESVPLPLQVIQDGDLIALVGQGETQRCELLAPCLSEPVRVGWTFEVSRNWHLYTRAFREYFHGQQFFETPTPLLVPSPGTEPFLEPFETAFHFGSQRQRLFLPFSPEFHLKKLLSLGWERIFELKPCFRNGELSPTHQPEFWMAEWYRAGGTLSDLMEDVERLIRHLCTTLNQPTPPRLQVVSIADLFAQAFDFKLTPSTSRDELLQLAHQVSVDVADDDSWDDLFFRLFIDKIERQLGFAGPIAVRDYPPSQAALARLNDRGWAERFEVYWNGLELANAFFELNDPVEQKRRFELELSQRQAQGGVGIELDPGFLQALQYGMPPSAGIALGVERLFMAIFRLSSLNAVRPFPITDVKEK